MPDDWKTEIRITGAFLSIAPNFNEIEREFYFQASQALKELREWYFPRHPQQEKK